MPDQRTSRLDAHTPVIVGVGQYLNRDDANPTSPIDLAATAARAAATDCAKPELLEQLDAIAVTPIVSWRYSDPGRLIGASLGSASAFTLLPSMGGNTPQLLMNRVCERIAAGELSTALVCGAEAYRSRMRAKKNGAELRWTRQDLDLEPGWSDGNSFEMGHPAEYEIGVMMPAQTYPLFENALRHESNRSASEHIAYIAEIWSRYSHVASTNPYAWDTTEYSAEEIATVTASNRILGYPYTKHMVSNPDVDMASAVIVCSVERAEALGISSDLWVFPQAGTDAKDPFLSNRSSFTGSAAIRHAGRRTLELAGVEIDDIAHLDIYSCFPSAVEIGCAELAISTDRQLTVYGGLCFAGGPWNNPVGHAIASMVQVLRENPGDFGLVTANGGNIQKHSFGMYNTTPPANGFRTDNPQDSVDAEGTVDIDPTYEGPATIEAWTVMHERDGSIGRTHAAARTPSGARTWLVNIDPEIGAAFETDDPIGQPVTAGSDHQLILH